MSHTVLIKALKCVAGPKVGTSDTQYVAAFLTTQRQLFNSLAPILPSAGWLVRYNSVEPVLHLLLRADTFRFATSICICAGLDEALMRELLSTASDFVVSVEFNSWFVEEEQLTMLMQLPHLERVTVCRNISLCWNESLRALLKHPRESVRRSVAASTAEVTFEHMSREQHATIMRDVIIPLVDSASCNGAAADFSTLASAACWKRLPRDVIMMLGHRMFQFFTAANSHSELIDKSLRVLAQLAYVPTSATSVSVDVFKEWPLLELLPEMMRRGSVLVEMAGFGSVVRSIFSSAAIPEISLHKERFFALQIPDITYDSYFARTGKSPFEGNGDVNYRFTEIVLGDPMSLLTATNVIQKELRHFLVPWHQESTSRALLLQRRGEYDVDFLTRSESDTLNIRRKTGFLHFFFWDLLGSLCHGDKAEMAQVVRLFFDDDELNFAPILRSYLLHGSRGNFTILCESCREGASLERRRERRRCRRQRRDGEGQDDAASCRCYLSEFLDSLDSLPQRPSSS